MIVTITKPELEQKLELRVVYDVLREIHSVAQRWDGECASIPKVRGVGYLAETGARNINEGNTPINERTTFGQMKEIDQQMYEGTIDFICPVVQSGIYAV